MKLTGLITLSKAICLKSNCLNKSIHLDFNKFKGQLLTPSLPPDFQKNKECYNKKPLIQPSNDIGFIDELEWGQPYSWPNGESWVSRFIIEIELPKTRLTKTTKDKLQNSIENWIKAFELNLFAIGYNNTHPVISYENVTAFNVNFYRKKNTGKTEDLKKRSSLSVLISHPESIDFIDFKYICEKTSENKTLSLALRFLKEAHIALKMKEYRKSILNCATAFEIALENCLSSNLPIKNADLLKEIIRQNNSISRKRKLLKFLSIELPKYNYQKDVEDIRNSAIHSGKSIDKSQAILAHKIVKEALEVLITNKLE